MAHQVDEEVEHCELIADVTRMKKKKQAWTQKTQMLK
jgi:hypothetical protein